MHAPHHSESKTVRMGCQLQGNGSSPGSRLCDENTKKAAPPYPIILEKTCVAVLHSSLKHWFWILAAHQQLLGSSESCWCQGSAHWLLNLNVSGVKPNRWFPQPPQVSLTWGRVLRGWSPTSIINVTWGLLRNAHSEPHSRPTASESLGLYIAQPSRSQQTAVDS